MSAGAGSFAASRADPYVLGEGPPLSQELDLGESAAAAGAGAGAAAADDWLEEELELVPGGVVAELPPLESVL